MIDNRIGKIIGKVGRQVLLLGRWFTNYLERAHQAELTDEMRDQIRDIRAMVNQLERDLDEK